MATLTIGNRRISVDDAFHDLPSDEQHAAVAEIASQLRARPAEQAGAAAAPASIVRVGPRPSLAAAPAAAMPSVAMAQDRAPVDFGIHGGQPIAPFGFAGPMQASPSQPLAERGPDAPRPARIGRARAAADTNAAILKDEFSHLGTPAAPDWADLAKSAAIGPVNGVVNALGFPAQVAKALGAAPAWVDDWTPEGLQHHFEQLYGSTFYQPRTRAGHYAETIGEFMPMAVGGGLLGMAFKGAEALAAARAAVAGNFVKHAVAPGIAVQMLEDADPQGEAGPVLKKAYPWARRGLPWALAARRALR